MMSIGILKQIQQIKLFSSLTIEQCQELECTLLELNPNEILLKQGESAQFLYIVLEGKLLAKLCSKTDSEQVIDTIYEGHTIGELGVISGKPYSLTVVAVKKCKLLKVNYDNFRYLYMKYPQILEEMTRVLITRTQKNVQLLSGLKYPQFITVVSSTDLNSWGELIHQVKTQLQATNVFILDDRQDTHTEQSILKLISDTKNTGSIVVNFIQNIDSTLTKLNVEYSDRIFVVASPQDQVGYSNLASRFLSDPEFSHIKHDLILLHSNSTIQHTTPWIINQSFSMYHNVRLQNLRDIQRLCRHIIGKPIGLVLGGGGAKAWAEIGAIKAIMEHDIPIDAIGGASAGAFIAACYAANQDIKSIMDKAESWIRALYPAFALRNFTWPIISLLNGKNTTTALQKIFGELYIEELILPYFCISCNLNSKQSFIHTHGKLWSKIRASIAVPGIFPPFVDEGQLHVDGGLINNFPVRIMKDFLGDNSRVIAVNLSEFEADTTQYKFDPVFSLKEALFYKLGLSKKQYIFPSFLDLFMYSLMVGESSIEQENMLLADVLIRPDVRKYHLFSIDMRIAEEIMNIGYQAALTQLQNWPYKSNIECNSTVSM